MPLIQSLTMITGNCKRVIAAIQLRGLFVIAMSVASVSALAADLTPITLQLIWQHQFQFAGYYAAQEKGFYREKGLDVRFVEAGPTTNVADEVTSGRAQFGVGNSSLLLARQQGKPVVALAVIFQHSSLVLLGHVYAGINSIQDLKGKRVMLEPHADELRAYLHRENIPEDSLNIVPHSFSSEELILGRVDAMSGYSTSETFDLDKSYLPYVVLSPRAAGIDFYGDNLFTSEAEIRKYPRRVKAFREASLKGWEYAMAHPEEIVELILQKYGDRRSKEFLHYEAQRMRPLISHDLMPIGYMHEDRWRQIIKTYVEVGRLPANFKLDPFLYINDSKEDLNRERRHWLIGLALALTIGVMAVFFATRMRHLNQRMRREMVAREQAVAELKQSESKFRFLAENSGDVIWTLDIASGYFTYVSPSVHALRGYTQEEVMAQPLEASVTPESAEHAKTILGDAIASWQAGDRSRTVPVMEIDQPHKDGRIINTEVVTTLHANAEGKLDSVIGVTRNITERKRAEKVIRQMAFYDPLTQLPNRRLLLDRIPQQIARAHRDQTRLALLFIDLDKFKPVNDEFGHETGDWLLQCVTQRLKENLRETDTAARIGGDEFVVVLSDLGDTLDAITVAEKICQSLKQPFTTDSHIAINISSSIGIALFPDHGDNTEALLRLADHAMYRAKHAGRNRVELYSPLHAPEHEVEQRNSGSFVRLIWKPSFCCGNPWIDQQHRELFDLANTLLDQASAEDFDGEDFNRAFDTLITHVVDHFADEEEILENRHYEDFAEHTKLHHALIERATELRKKAEGKNITIGELVAFLVNEVVARHMLRDDRKFFSLFSRNAGASEE